MASYNSAAIIGNIGKNPELRTTKAGLSVVSLDVATSETWKDKEGNKQEKVEWHKVQVWGRSAEACAKYLTKGSSVFVTGRLQTRKSEKDGHTYYNTEIVADDVKFLSSAGGERREAPQPEEPPHFARSAQDPISINDIPF